MRQKPDGVQTWSYTAVMEINMLETARRITGCSGDYPEANIRWEGMMLKEHSDEHWTVFEARCNTTYDIYMQDTMPPIEEMAPEHPLTKIFDARPIDLRQQAWKQEEEKAKVRDGFKKMPSQINFGF